MIEYEGQTRRGPPPTIALLVSGNARIWQASILKKDTHAPRPSLAEEHTNQNTTGPLISERDQDQRRESIEDLLLLGQIRCIVSRQGTPHLACVLYNWKCRRTALLVRYT